MLISRLVFPEWAKNVIAAFSGAYGAATPVAPESVQLYFWVFFASMALLSFFLSWLILRKTGPSIYARRWCDDADSFTSDSERRRENIGRFVGLSATVGTCSSFVMFFLTPGLKESLLQFLGV